MSGTTGYGIELQGSPVMGMKDAPIDMYYWSDYTCPWCKTFALKIHPKIAKNEVANGVLRVVFLELPYKTKNSWPASILAKCVWREVSKTNPDLYWKWHHAVFKAQEEPGNGWADLKNLFEITKDVGIDTKPIAKCIENRQKKIKADIKAEKETANKTGVKGTPAFLLYNRQTGEKAKVAGAQPYSRFSAKIQSLQGN
jgi:protein-disulfide isomerase